MDTVTVFQDKDNQWRWNRKAANGEIISTSGEGYKNKQHAVLMASRQNSSIEANLVVESNDPIVGETQ